MGSISDVDLIKLIQAHPILYDKDLARGSRNNQKKDEAWRQLSMELNASERALITRWKSLRDRFGKEYRRVLENPGEPVTWDMFPQMMFLKDHYKHGIARDSEITTIKYEPKVGKRRSRQAREDRDEVSNNEEELDTEEDHFVNQRLIAMVKQHEVIYDKLKIRDSKNLTAKNDAWREISENMGISEEICYRRWKKLRDRFAREIRRHHIFPDQTVEWEYFNDLMFLAAHYRKGVPLDVNNLKRCGRPPKNRALKKIVQPEESPWGTETTTFESIDGEQPMPEETQDYDVMKHISHIDLTEDDMTMGLVSKDELCERENTMLPDGLAQPVEQLCAVIDNMEAVLQQSQECLQSLRKQQQQHQIELVDAANSHNPDQPMIVQKMNVLFEGLSPENRSKAEVKIIKFLCECQIKTLNNEIIDDIIVSDIH